MRLKRTRLSYRPSSPKIRAHSYTQAGSVPLFTYDQPFPESIEPLALKLRRPQEDGELCEEFGVKSFFQKLNWIFAPSLRQSADLKARGNAIRGSGGDPAGGMGTTAAAGIRLRHDHGTT